MECVEIERILKESRERGDPQQLTGPLSVLAAFQCRGFTEVINERSRLIRSCEDAIWRMRSMSVEPHQDIIRLIEHMRM